MNKRFLMRYLPLSTFIYHGTIRQLSSLSTKDFKSIKYFTEDRVAHIQLNRPDRLNAIDKYMPFEIQKAVHIANFDDEIHVILLYGAGDVFCAGYDLKAYAEESDSTVGNDSDSPDYVNQGMPWDPALDYM